VKGALIALGVVGVGTAAYLIWRGHSQQQIQRAGAQAAAVGATPATGGGVSGLAGRLFSQWKADPLGIQQTKSTISGVVGVAGNAVSSVGSAVSGIFSGIGSIF
jgi:hypothetical protein